jgi:gamma-D-glutamyl-L-lysine dipeptidyl-peptidase
MPHGICLFSIVPARKEPNNTSEMLTQLLFGEHYTVLENKEGWIRIKTAFDHYECWINAKQHQALSDNHFKQLQKQPPVYSNDLVHTMYNKLNRLSFPILIGSTLPFFENKKLSFEAFVFEYDGQVIHANAKKPIKEILSTAFLFLNSPYLWGGKSPFGIDCSGFTQMVYKLNGYVLPRDAYQQVELGSPLSFVDEAEAGDLAFFDNEEGKIVHVGILLNKQEIIHASGCVRIDAFDHYGIFNKDTKKYTHLLRVIKRIL